MNNTLAFRTAFKNMRNNRLYNASVLGTTLANVLSAMSPSSGLIVTGGTVDGRGLTPTDNRFSKLTGIEFIGKYPHCSLFALMKCAKQANVAVAGRKYAKKPLTGQQYLQSLIIRNLRGQILNPVLRIDYAVRLLEKLRKSAMSNKFVVQAMKPHNAPAAVNLIAFA